MGFSGCRIPGHSGTDQKNRKAFKKAKETQNIYLYNYGDQFGRSDEIKIDHQRMHKAERSKIRKQTILLTSLFSVFIVIAMALSYWMILLDRRQPPKWNFEKPIIATEYVQLDMDNLEFLRHGYLAWEKKDYNSAILWFEQVADHKDKWTRKECAFFGLYNEMCSAQNLACEKADFYTKKLHSLFQEFSKAREETISSLVGTYNAKMKTYFNQSITNETPESISFITAY